MPGQRFTKAKGPWVGSDAVGAPTNASYVVIGLDATLTDERVLTAGAGITITDGGANGPVTIAVAAPGSSTFVALVDAANIALDASLGENFQVTIAGNRTLDTPTNPANGQLIRVRVTQDAIGGRTLAFGAGYRFSTDLPSPVIANLPNQISYMTFLYHEIDLVWDYVGQVFGF